MEALSRDRKDRGSCRARSTRSNWAILSGRGSALQRPKGSGELPGTVDPPELGDPFGTWKRSPETERIGELPGTAGHGRPARAERAPLTPFAAKRVASASTTRGRSRASRER